MKTTMREGVLVCDTHKLTDLMGLPIYRILVIGVTRQPIVLTKDGAHPHLVDLCNRRQISFKTADRLEQAVNDTRLPKDTDDLVGRIDQYPLPHDYRPSTHFNLCPCGGDRHGELIFGGQSFGIVDTFLDGFNSVMSIVEDDDRVKAIEAAAALKQIRAAKLPVSKSATDSLISLLDQILTGDMPDGRSSTRGGGYGDPRRSQQRRTDASVGQQG